MLQMLLEKKNFLLKEDQKKQKKNQIFQFIKLSKTYQKKKKLYKSINSPKFEVLNGFLGKKRENKQKYIGIKNVEENSSHNKILYCVKCSWKFPAEMPDERRNMHIYKCLEGKGNLDIIENNEEEKFKIYKNYSNKK